MPLRSSWISGACSFDCSDRRRGCQSPPATSGSPVEPLSGSGRSRLATTAPCSSWGAMRPRDWSALGFTGLAYCSRPLHLLFDGLNKVQQIDNSQVRGSLFARAVSRPTANPFTALLGFGFCFFPTHSLFARIYYSRCRALYPNLQ